MLDVLPARRSNRVNVDHENTNHVPGRNVGDIWDFYLFNISTKSRKTLSLIANWAWADFFPENFRGDPTIEIKIKTPGSFGTEKSSLT
jgi:hypothetical protein